MCAGSNSSESNTSDGSHEHARCRVRTCISPVERQGVASADSQIDSQKIRSDADLIELIELWRGLSRPMQCALLAVAQASAAAQMEDRR
jgi:hypothetical protein